MQIDANVGEMRFISGYALALENSWAYLRILQSFLK